MSFYKIPVVLSEGEQKAILKTFNERYPTRVRDKTMVMVMLRTGLRLAETLDLMWRNVNLMTGQMGVFGGKHGKDRIIWLDEVGLEQMRKWRERQAEELAKRGIEGPADRVFTTLKGGRLDDGNVRRMVYRHTERAGIQKNVSPHTFRHTFATDLYRETQNIRLVQKAMGHADLSTTMIYTHIVDGELEEAMKTFKKKAN